MKKLIHTLSFLFIFSCQTNSQTLKKNTIKETIISSTDYDNNKAVKRNFSIKKPKEDTLKIKLYDSKILTFINNKGIPFDEDRVSYFKDSLDSKHTLINIKEYENEYYLLINNELGKIDTIPDYPYFSKNKAYLLVIGYNPYETYNDIVPPTEYIYIYRYKKNELEIIYKKPFHLYSETYLESFYWKNNNEINLKFINESNNTYKKYLSIKLEN